MPPLRLNPGRLVVTGTDTGVGKTVVAAMLARALGAAYWKPVQAGTDDEGRGDGETVAAIAGLSPERILPCAYRLATPCSPHRAARIDGVAIEASRLAVPEHDGPLVIEGAGGALVPLTFDRTYADQFATWGLPVAIVARTALGTINHSLLTIEALRARGVPILGVAFVGAPEPDSEATIAQMGKVRRLGRLPHLPRLDAPSLDQAFAENFSAADFAS